MKAWKKLVAGTTVAGTLMGGFGLSGAAVAAPPEPVTFTDIWRCDGFKVKVEAEGDAGFIEVPGLDEFITTSPNTTVTLTNLRNDNTVTYKVNGTFHIENDGRLTVVTATGVNLLSTPEPGIYLISGNVNFTVRGKREIERFSGPGNVTDVCEVLA